MNIIVSFRGDYSFLSNFHSCIIKYGGCTYNSVETAFQAQKDPDSVDLFRNMSVPEATEVHRLPIIDPGAAKRIGRKVPMRKDWNTVKDRIMLELLIVKFTQNSDLQKRLLDTGDAILIEGNNWHDNYWGFCKCPNCVLKDHYNKLGTLLMDLRSALRDGSDPVYLLSKY